MPKNPHIYTVVTMTSVDPNDRDHCKATVGFFYSKAEAVDAILRNACDIYEDGCYPYALIEELHPGLYPIPPVSELWFHWDPLVQGYHPIDRPSSLSGIVGFSL